jgi:branched-subunit amino acid transport protein
VAELWVLLALCGVATYAFRGLGVLLSGGLRAESEVFAWISCVAYAMIAGLIARMLLMPTGALAETTALERAIGTGVALGAYFALTRKNLFVGVFAGAVAVWLLRLAAR